VPTVALVFSEATRLRYFHYARSGYLEGLKRLWLGLWSDSVIAEVVGAADLSNMAFLSKYPVIVLMESSGLSEAQISGLVAYADAGGSVVITGDALLYDANGGFTTSVVTRLRDTLGVNYTAEKVCSKFGLRLTLSYGGTDGSGPAAASTATAEGAEDQTVWTPPSCWRNASAIAADGAAEPMVLGTATASGTGGVAAGTVFASKVPLAYRKKVGMGQIATVLWRYDADFNLSEEPCPACTKNDYRYISSGCCGGQTNDTTVISTVVMRLLAERHALPAIVSKRPPATQHTFGNGSYSTVPHTKASIAATGRPLTSATPEQAEKFCNGQSWCAGFDFFSCAAGGKMCADFKTNVVDTEHQEISTLYKRPLINESADPRIRSPRRGAAAETVRAVGEEAADANVDAEFILTEQPLDVIGYGRSHLLDGRATPSRRFNLYFLGGQPISIDLCMPDAPQQIASLYPRDGWNATIEKVEAAKSACPLGSGASVAARVTVTSTGGLNHRAVVLV
jgi:hypothetical protein